MKAAVFWPVFFSVVMTTLSQPTYDLEQQQFCPNNDCRQQDLKTLQDQFTSEFTAMKNEMDEAKNAISKLKEQVDNLLAILTGVGGITGNETVFPESYPTSIS